MSDESIPVGDMAAIAAAEATATANFTAALQAQVAAPQAPAQAPAAPVAPAPVPVAPVPAQVTSGQVAPATPATPLPGASETPTAEPPAPATPDFADAALVAAGAKIGLTPDMVQAIWRGTSQGDRPALLERMGVTPTPTGPVLPPPIDPAQLHTELVQYLTTRDPEGSQIFQNWTSHNQRLSTLSGEISAAEQALADAAALVRVASREGADEFERADANRNHLDAKMKLGELKMEHAERSYQQKILDLQYQQLYKQTRDRVYARHQAEVARIQRESSASAEAAAYQARFNTELESAVDRIFPTLGLDPSFKGTRPNAESPDDYSFWSYVFNNMTRAALKGPIDDVGAFITALAPRYSAVVQKLHAAQAGLYGRLATQRAAVPGPAPGISPVATPEAQSSFDGDLAALDERIGAAFARDIRALTGRAS